MKILTNAKRIIAFVLTLTLLAILPIQTVAAAEDGGYLRCMLGDADDRDAQLLMRALELGIRQLAQSYPENIRIHCETPA